MKITLCLALVVVLALGTGVPAVRGQTAGEPNKPAIDASLAYEPPAWPEVPSLSGLLWRLGLGTGLVLALCLGTLWTGQRWLRRSPLKAMEGNQLQLLQKVPLGPRCALYLLQAGQQHVVIGIDTSGLQSIVTLPDGLESVVVDKAAAA